MIQGDILAFLNALGRRETDPEFLALLSLIGAGDYERTRFADAERDEQEEYLEMPNNGIDMLFVSGSIESVFVYATLTKDHSPYAGWGNLVEGLTPEMDQATVTSILGVPLRVTSLGMTYGAGGGYLQFEFAGGRLSQVVLMRELIGGVPATVASTPVSGDLATFIAAVGTSEFSPEHQQAIVLGGAQLEIKEEQRSGASWETYFFGPTGLMLQFKDKKMVGALVRLVANESGGMAGFPWPEKLISGISLPWSRKMIRDRLGDPVDSTQHEDLYILDDRYVRFTFEDEICTEVSIALAGVSNT